MGDLQADHTCLTFRAQVSDLNGTCRFVNTENPGNGVGGDDMLVNIVTVQVDTQGAAAVGTGRGKVHILQKDPVAGAVQTGLVLIIGIAAASSAASP